MQTDLKFGVQIDDKQLSVVYITTNDLAERCIQLLLESKSPVLGFDIETGKKPQHLYDPVAGLCAYRSFPSLVQFYDSTNSRVYMFDTHQLPIQQLQPIFTTKRVIAHNAIFDLQHMKHNGLKVPVIDCSMIMYNLVRCAEGEAEDETEEEGEGELIDWISKAEKHGASLRAVVANLLGVRVEKELQTSNWTDRPLSKEQLFYAAKDAYFTYEAGKILASKIKDLGLGNVYRLNREALHPVTTMILNGVSIDEKKHRKCCKVWQKDRDKHQVTVLRHFGSLTNIRSTHHISKWLESKLPIEIQHIWPRSEKTGKLRSDAKSLTIFSHLPFVTPLLEYKKLDKLLSTYGPSLLDKICPVTKRLHGSYTLGYTQTGRLSSRNPNLQNQVRGSELRSIFIAEEGHRLVGADYSQIEIRVASELSRDAAMLTAYRTGVDLHSFLASRITGKPVDKISKEDRQLSKALGFGMMFGLGAKGLVDYARWNYGVKLTEEEAYTHYRTFFDTYKGYALWQKKKRDEAAKLGTTTTVMGKLRKLQDIGAYTRSVNHPVQGSAAEVVITALNLLQKRIDNNQRDAVKLLLCVHDEIVLEVKSPKVEEAKKLLETAMVNAYLTLFKNGITNKLVDVKDGRTWAELK